MEQESHQEREVSDWRARSSQSRRPRNRDRNMLSLRKAEMTGTSILDLL